MSIFNKLLGGRKKSPAAAPPTRSRETAFAPLADSKLWKCPNCGELLEIDAFEEWKELTKSMEDASAKYEKARQGMEDAEAKFNKAIKKANQTIIEFAEELREEDPSLTPTEALSKARLIRLGFSGDLSE